MQENSTLASVLRYYSANWHSLEEVVALHLAQMKLFPYNSC